MPVRKVGSYKLFMLSREENRYRRHVFGDKTSKHADKTGHILCSFFVKKLLCMYVLLFTSVCLLKAI